jgi:hypothetical protein
VGFPAGRGKARRHERLAGDMTSDDVMCGIVELRGDEVIVVDTVDCERGDHFGQGRRVVRHPGIMP